MSLYYSGPLSANGNVERFNSELIRRLQSPEARTKQLHGMRPKSRENSVHISSHQNQRLDHSPFYLIYDVELTLLLLPHRATNISLRQILTTCNDAVNIVFRTSKSIALMLPKRCRD